MKRNYANYHVALKLLLTRDGEVLFLKTHKGQLDLPGGRMDDVEHHAPLAKILAREIREELGAKIKYRLGAPAFQYRRHFDHKEWHIFLTVYEGRFLSGDIKISKEHSGFVWIDPHKYKFRRQDFFNQEEYRIFTKYFNSHSRL